MVRSFPRAIAHVDCDAFFASVEQAVNPALKGKPVVVGKDRGIAAAMSYEAKEKGVVRGMRIHEVRKVCPDAVIVPCDYETYSLFSKRFYGILRRFTPDVEEYSIDEAFADISGLRRVHRVPYEMIAMQMKEALERELGITVSVGLSITKALAKIASRENKPSGFTCVRGYDLHSFLKTVPVHRVCGFGPNSTALLNKHGIRTVWDYVNLFEAVVRKFLGKIGGELWNELRGNAVYRIVKSENRHQASLGKTKTFTPPSNDKEFVRAQILRNVESAFIKLRRHHLRAVSLSVYLTDSEFKSRGLYAELTRPTGSTLDAAAIVSGLFEKLFDPRLRYRRTGVVLSSLEIDRESQPDLFEDTCRVKKFETISRVIDDVNKTYGKHAVHLGSTDLLSRFRHHLGERGDFASRKKELLPGETFRRRVRLPLWKVKI
jgi:DNA polymerase-4/DNA polymerase V